MGGAIKAGLGVILGAVVLLLVYGYGVDMAPPAVQTTIDVVLDAH